MADVSEVASNEGLAELSISELDFVVERPSRSIFQHHVSGVFFFLVVVVQEFDDVGMIQFVVNVDFFLGIFIVDLPRMMSTILMATTSPFSVLRANLTSP